MYLCGYLWGKGPNRDGLLDQDSQFSHIFYKGMIFGNQYGATPDSRFHFMGDYKQNGAYLTWKSEYHDFDISKTIPIEQNFWNYELNTTTSTLYIAGFGHMHKLPCKKVRDN